MGRRKDKVRELHFEASEGGKVKCKHCKVEYAATTSVTRLRAHILKQKDRGIEVCTHFPPPNNSGSDNPADCNHDLEPNPQLSQGPPQSTSLKDQLIHSDRGFSMDGPIDHRKSHDEGQIQGDAKDEESIQVWSSSVSNRENEYLQVLRYAFEWLSPTDTVYESGCFHLEQKHFITLKPETWLDSLVIDIFAEILTKSEKEKATPSNCYLPVMLSSTALEYYDENFEKYKRNFEDFVRRNKMRKQYIFDQKSLEKVFIPVHTGQGTSGHFYLYILYLNKNIIEIWDSLHKNKSVAATERDVTNATKLLFAMEILFEKEKGAFSNYKLEWAKDILPQDNGCDCGVFVIKYMQQSDNYVKRNPLFQFDSKKEREDLALKLLTNDLNQEKQNLYDEARGYYAQDDFGEEDDDFDEEDDDSDEDDVGLENDLIGSEFQRYTEQIRKWIEDDKVSTIGVWGMGGSGKTALASHVYDKLLEGDIKVIWVTVSQNSIYKLQKVMARSIGLDNTDDFEVKVFARKIFQAFKEMKKCVVILDDVWDNFFLKEVGFPMSDNRTKLILTTRIWEVCEGIGCDHKNKIEMGRLGMDDSQALFKKTMGPYEGLSLEVKRIVDDVAYECEGLPLAIVRIATSMKGKEQVGEWSHMLECLKNLGHEQYEMDKWVFPVLRSSYDFLSKKLQRFFLYCALSSKEFLDEEEADHLIRRFVYERIDETKKLRVQYNEGYNMLNRLNNHSMLERYRKQWRMNKFLRALATGIAEDTGKIMANAYKNLTKIPSDDQWKEDLQKAFLTGNKIEKIPDGRCLWCSQLSTLLLNGNRNLNYISDDFFKNMPALKILDLSRTDIERLPDSMSSLKCLTALLLLKCIKLSYIPSLSKLKQLISLDLFGAGAAIINAPTGFKSLVNLRYLNLLCIHTLMSASLISELINLDNLEVIVGYFQDISVFNKYVNSLDERCVLGSYHLTSRNSSHYDYDEGINREYSMKRITFRDMDLIEAVLPGDIKRLDIMNCQLVGTVGRRLCSVVSSYSRNNNNNPHQIESLDIRECENVEYLCCFSDSCPFCSSSKLVGWLHLEKLKDLKDIVSPGALVSQGDLLSSHQPSLFSQLKDLQIVDCNSMETLMTPELLALFPNLCRIFVSGCQQMEKIVGVDDNHPFDPTIHLPKLESLKLGYMRQLVFVYRGVMLCPCLQTFVALGCEELKPPQIEKSEISNGCELPMEKTATGYSWGIKTD